MSVSNPTNSDRIRWICNTSTEEGRAEIKRLESDDALNPNDLLAILEAAFDYETKQRAVPRKSLVTALSLAVLKAKRRVGSAPVTIDQSASQPLEILSPETVHPVNTVDLIRSINANHLAAQQDAAQARVLGESAVRRAIVAGLQLIQLRDATPHGQWEGLFASGQKRLKNPNGTHECHLEMNRMTASRYIAVATQLVTKKLQPEQSQALMALAAGADPDESAQTLLDEITPPKSLRQTYLELGIVKPTPKEAQWLSADPAQDPSDPSDPSDKKPSAITKLRSARESARRDWFGESKPGHCAPGSPVSLIETELTNPARGTLRLLSKEDLELLADYFRRVSKAAAELTKEK